MIRLVIALVISMGDAMNALKTKEEKCRDRKTDTN